MNFRPIQYRADIDGLRAVAVISVLLFHAKIGITGGYVGVDIFFVISGYLITQIIFDDQQFTLSGFYDRRARRILPALFTVLIAALGVGAVILLPADLKSPGRGRAILRSIPLGHDHLSAWQNRSQARLGIGGRGNNRLTFL